jgi:hypothetical protein
MGDYATGRLARSDSAGRRAGRVNRTTRGQQDRSASLTSHVRNAEGTRGERRLPMKWSRNGWPHSGANAYGTDATASSVAASCTKASGAVSGPQARRPERWSSCLRCNSA